LLIAGNDRITHINLIVNLARNIDGCGRKLYKINYEECPMTTHAVKIFQRVVALRVSCVHKRAKQIAYLLVFAWEHKCRERNNYFGGIT
jgi:hypothetical protein